MIERPKPLSRIVIVGGGSAGWMAAAALAQALTSGVTIEVVESDALGTVGVGEATIPAIRSYLTNLGIDERAFLRFTRGTFKLGIDFVGWRSEGQRYFHPFGTLGPGFDFVPFHQYWLRERLRGAAGPLDRYLMGAVAARHARFAFPSRDPANVLSTFDYAYHFDASLFASFLHAFAGARGVRRTEGLVVDVVRHGETGLIAELVLDDGRRIAGDFFIDCSGFASLLIGRALSVGFRDWSAMLPCDRAVAVASEGAAGCRPCTTSTAMEAGWRWHIPLRHRTGNGYVFSSANMSEDAAAAALLHAIDGRPLGDPRILRFTTGRREVFWSGNCLALGLAAGFMEPLESTNLHLVQTGIARFIALYPDSPCDALSIAEYNRLTIEEHERIRDFLVLHYHANAREDGALWRYCREMKVPDALAWRIENFLAAGRLVSPGPELFHNSSWLAVLVGQGLMPRAYDPIVDRRTDVPAASHLDDIRRIVAAVADKMPRHDDVLAEID